MAKTASQIVKEDGKALGDSVSAPGAFLYDHEDPKVDRYKQPFQFEWGKLFSQAANGNDAKFYTTGQDYFTDVAKAIKGAKKTVFITGWQINFDVELSGKETLFHCLDAAVKNGATVYVMPWLSPKFGVDTGDFETILAVYQLNAGRKGALKAFALPAIQQSDMEGDLGIGFSHHQKLVVIDDQYAFVGGIDLAYGRRDDGKCALSAGGRSGNELYNPCVPHIKKYKRTELVSYLTRGELLAACYDNNAGKLGTFLLSAPIKEVAEVMDGASETIESTSEWIGDTKEGITSWWNSWNIDHELVHWLKKQGNNARDKAYEAQDAYVDAQVAASKWAWTELSPTLQEKLQRMQTSKSGNAATAAAAVMAWLNSGRLDQVPDNMKSAVVARIERLILWTVTDLFSAASARTGRYENLDKLGKMAPAGGAAVDPTLQPRMPWHDVQCRIEGPAVYDLSMNFVRRWQSVALRYEKIPIEGKRVKVPRVAAGDLPKKKQPLPGKNVWVQTLRSAPFRLVKEEAAAMQEQAPALRQNNCLKAWLSAIAGAQHFIYIENQFFQSFYGTEGGLNQGDVSGPMGALIDIRRSPNYPTYARMLEIENVRIQDIPKRIRWAKVDDVQRQPGGPEFLEDLHSVLSNMTAVQVSNQMGKSQSALKNPIAQALVDRVTASLVGDGKPIHVYIVLPVHPEGTLNTLNIMHQVHLTMQSLVYGTNSLVNGVRRAIYAAKIKKQKKLKSEAAIAEAAKLTVPELEQAVGEGWREHLTLLNLRNWETIGSRPVTEQIYVHSKLIIVDDRLAILGSANINDRSQWGDRDSELAVMIRDGSKVKVMLDGKHAEDVSACVHELRKNLWKKIFGLAGGVRPASSLASVLDKPAAPATWKAIQEVAKDNASQYEQAFLFIPRNSVSESARYVHQPAASIWPTWRYHDPTVHSKGGKLVFRMPFDTAFWVEPKNQRDVLHTWSTRKNAPEVAPKGVEGFITALPTRWTLGEDNRSGMNLTMLANLIEMSRPGSAYAMNEIEPTDSVTG